MATTRTFAFDGEPGGGGGDAAAEVAAHSADTTSVHGITDTSALVRKGELVYNVMDYAAVGDGTTDDAAAIQAAADAAAAADGVLFMPAGETFRINSTVTIKGHCQCAGATLTTAVALAPALEVRHASGGGVRLQDKTCALPNVVQTAQVWVAAALPTAAGGFAALDTGVRLTNLIQCKVSTGRVTAFSVGLYLYAAGTVGYTAYNTIDLGFCENNKVNLLCGTDNSTTNTSVAAACNQNTFIGGRLSHYGLPTNVNSKLGTRHILLDASPSNINNVVVIGTSVEGDAAEYHVENYGRDVVLLGVRWEVAAVSAKYHRATRLVTCADATTVTVNCRNDTIAWGYNSDGVVVTNSSGTTGHVRLTPIGVTIGAATISTSAGINSTAGPVLGGSFRVGSSGTGPTWTTGTGTPEGAVTAPVGSVHSRSNGAADTSLYVKETGVGNTGWIAVGAGAGAELFVRVEDHGAVGDDTADDTTALNAAIAAGQSSGRPVAFLADTTYKITAGLAAITAPVTIVGNGATIRQATASAGVLAVTSSNVVIDGLRLLGPGGGTFDAAQPKGIYVHGATWAGRISDVRITGCRIEGFKMYGVYAQYVERLRVQSCVIDDIWHGGVFLLSVANSTVDDNDISNIRDTFNAYGVAASRTESGTTLVSDPRASDIDITNNRVSGIPSWEALDTHGGVRIKFVGNTITGCKYGIAVGSGDDPTNTFSWYAPLDCTVANNVIDSGLTNGAALVGINFTGAPDSPERATGTITGNTIRGYGAENSANSGAILLHDTDGVAISDNTIINPSPNGINLYFTNRGVTVTGNTIIDVWTDTVGVGEAIAVKVSSTNNSGVISGNSFTRGDLTGKTYILDKGIRTPNSAGVSIVLGPNRSTATTYLVDNSPAGSVYSAIGRADAYGGTGSPLGVITAKPGSVYLNANGGDGTTLYLKETGTGTAGWVAVGTHVSTAASSATPTPNADTDEVYAVTALAVGAVFGAPTGTPRNGQSILIRVKDDGTARTLGWNAVYRPIGLTLPTTTVISKTLYLGAKFNSADSKWDILAVGQEA